MVKEELCDKKMVEVRRISDRLLTDALFEEHVQRLICRYALQSGRSLEEEHSFMMS